MVGVRGWGRLFMLLLDNEGEIRDWGFISLFSDWKNLYFFIILN